MAIIKPVFKDLSVGDLFTLGDDSVWMKVRCMGYMDSGVCQVNAICIRSANNNDLNTRGADKFVYDKTLVYPLEIKGFLYLTERTI